MSVPRIGPANQSANEPSVNIDATGFDKKKVEQFRSAIGKLLGYSPTMVQTINILFMIKADPNKDVNSWLNSFAIYVQQGPANLDAVNKAGQSNVVQPANLPASQSAPQTPTTAAPPAKPTNAATPVGTVTNILAPTQTATPTPLSTPQFPSITTGNARPQVVGNNREAQRVVTETPTPIPAPTKTTTPIPSATPPLIGGDRPTVPGALPSAPAPVFFGDRPTTVGSFPAASPQTFFGDRPTTVGSLPAATPTPFFGDRPTTVGSLPAAIDTPFFGDRPTVVGSFPAGTSSTGTKSSTVPENTAGQYAVRIGDQTWTAAQVPGLFANANTLTSGVLSGLGMADTPTMRSIYAPSMANVDQLAFLIQMANQPMMGQELDSNNPLELITNQARADAAVDLLQSQQGAGYDPRYLMGLYVSSILDPNSMGARNYSNTTPANQVEDFANNMSMFMMNGNPTMEPILTSMIRQAGNEYLLSGYEHPLGFAGWLVENTSIGAWIKQYIDGGM